MGSRSNASIREPQSDLSGGGRGGGARQRLLAGSLDQGVAALERALGFVRPQGHLSPAQSGPS
ncbi:MAG TPA: hypothetical protein VGK66_02860, partial [Solirubrobacterales bacterium]